MKIKMREDTAKKEIEVEVVYPKWSHEVEAVQKRLTGVADTLMGEESGRKYTIPIYDIYYVESVERKTFIYTKNQVYRSELRLYEMIKRLPEDDFARVSKSCVLNLNVLDSVITLPNSKLEALLDNGEKIIISRTYLTAIRVKLEGGNNACKRN